MFTVAVLFLSVCLFCGVTTLVRANATAKTVDQVVFTMEEGASVRMSDDNGTNGLRFAASMSADDYNALVANEDYTQLVFGIVIAPADYLAGENKGFTKENLFGQNAIYAWDVYEDGNWVYDEEANAGKTRIINITATTLKVNSLTGKATITGSITNLYDNNIARDFVARAYICADGEYVLANYADSSEANNTRSMALVAEGAVADTSEQALSEAQKTWLTNNYLKKNTVYTDLTSNVVEMNNYDANSKVIDVTEFGTVKRITDGKGIDLAFTQTDNKVSLDISTITENTEIDAVVYAVKNGSYKLYGVKANVTVATLVSTPAQFLAIRNQSKGTFVLTQDIDMSGVTIDTAASVNFGGVLDGNGHTVSNVTLTSGATGFFKKLQGTTSAPATVKNIAFKNITTSANNQGGGLAFEIGDNVVVDNLYMSAVISSIGSGALCKNAWSTLSSTAKLSVTNSVLYVTSCKEPWNSGASYNGALGYSFTAGGQDETAAYIDLTGTRVVTDKYSHAFSSASSNVYKENTTIPVTLSELVDEISSKTVKYAYEKTLYSILGVNTISTEDEFLEVRTKTSGYYILTKDINLTNVSMPSVGTTFTGVLNGNGFKVTGMKLTATNQTIAYAGFFRSLAGTVKNIAFVDAILGANGGLICSQLNVDATLDNVYISGDLANCTYSGAISRQTQLGSMNETTSIKITNCVFVIKQVNSNSGILFGTSTGSSYNTVGLDLTGTYITTDATDRVIRGDNDGGKTFNTTIKTNYASNFYTKAGLTTAIINETVSVGYITLANAVLGID